MIKLNRDLFDHIYGFQQFFWIRYCYFNIQLNDNDGRCRVGYHSITEIRDDGKNDTGYPEITFAK